MQNNKPYVKFFNKEGILENTISGIYSSEFPNRTARRSKPKRFRGNNKGVSLTVVKTSKYKRVMQLIQMVGNLRNQTVENKHIVRKVINHYVGEV